MSYRTAQLKKSLASLFCLFLLAAYCLLLSADFSYAAINESFTFQGKIVDDDGTNLVNGDASCVSVGGADTCDFRVSLYTAVSGGTLVWQETKSNVELYDNDGIFNLFLDCGGTFSSCNQNGGPNFNSGDLFIQVEFDPDGDGDFAEGETFSPRRELSAVPYAFNAKQLDGQEGGSYLRSDATDAYTSGTLSFNSATELNTLSGSTLDIDGDLEIADTSITLNGATTTFNASGALTLLSTGDIAFQPDNDTDDYLYFDTTTNIPGLFWEGIAGTDPGIYVAGTELGYRDESDAWVSFDSLAVGTSPGGSDTQLQYNNGGSFGGVASLTYNDATDEITILDDITITFDHAENLEITSNLSGGNRTADIFGLSVANDASFDFSTGNVLSLSLLDTGSSADLAEFTNAGTGLSFRVNDESGDTTPFVIDEAGYVGIGEDDPQYPLDINGSGVNLFVNIGSATNQTSISSARFTTDTGYGLIYKNGSGYSQYGGTNALGLWNQTGPINFSPNNMQSAMLLDTAGSLGIADTTPDAKLEVLATTEQLRLTHTDNTYDAKFAVDGSGNLTVATTANFNFQPNGDTDDYLYLNTASDIPGLFWEGIAATDPGIYVSGTELGYRDEADAWVSFDSLGGGASDLDGAYDGDSDKILTIDSTTGLLFDMTTTGAFSIRDGTTAFWTFDDDSTVDVVFPAAGNLGISYSAAPTVDLMSISNAGFGTATDGVDGLSIDFVQGDDNNSDNNNGLRLTMTPSNDTDAGDILSGLRISTTSAITSISQQYYGIVVDSITYTDSEDVVGIAIGTGWPAGLSSGSPILASIYNPSGNGYGINSTIATTTGANTINHAIQANIASDPADSGDTLNGLYVISDPQAQSGSTVNLVNIDPAATGNTAGTLNGLRIDSITPNGATETAISIGSGWDTGIDAGSNVILNIGNSGTDFNTSGGLTLANSLTVTTGGATVSAGGLTITSGALAVNSDSITSDAELVINASSSVVLGDTTNGLRINETFGSTSGYLGNARPTKKITLSAEYMGAVLSAFYGAGTDTNITGTMTSDTETTTTNSLMNYYQWNRTNATLHYQTVAVRVTLPEDFSAWTTTNALVVNYVTDTTGTTSNVLDIRVYLESNITTAVASDTGNASGTADTWTTETIDDSAMDETADGGATEPEWDEAGETAIIYLRMGSASGEHVRIGDIELSYLSRF